MLGFCVLMFVFALLLLLAGLYMFTGHKLKLVLWRVPYKNLNKEEWKKVGKWTMIFSILPLLIAILVFIFEC